MDIDILAKIFDEYGFTGIVCFGLIVLLVLLSKWIYNNISKKFNNGIETITKTITDNMTQQNNSLISTINSQNEKLIDYIVKKDTDSANKHDKMLAARMAYSTEINNKLTDILNWYNADRAIIIEFHNSFNNLYGIPFAKYSCNFERYNKGVLSITNEMQAKPFSNIAYLYTDIIEHGGIQTVYDDIDTIRDNVPVLYDLLKKDKAHSLICNAIYDPNNVMIGVLMLEYKKDIPSHVDLSELKVNTVEISTILNLQCKV